MFGLLTHFSVRFRFDSSAISTRRPEECQRRGRKGGGRGREQGLAQLTGHVQRCLAQTVCKHKTQLNPLQPLHLLLLEQKLSLAALCVCPSVLGLYKIKTSGSAALNYMKRKLLTFLAAGREGGKGGRVQRTL